MSKYQDWENSIEGIMYSLKTMAETTKEDVYNNFLITKVLQKLPEKIREEVLDKVIFVHTIAYGTVSRMIFQEQTQYFIVFNFKCIKKDSTKMNTIAHEIAHFILRPKEPLTSIPSEIAEKEADDLAEKWGFSRCYKNYKQFKGTNTGV